MQFNTLNKTELWIGPVMMEGVNLNDVAAVTAEVLQLPKSQVLVVDVREDHISLDVLVDDIDADQLVGQKKALFDALNGIEGFSTRAETHIHSHGILGIIDLEEPEMGVAVKSAELMGIEILSHVAKRVCIYPTGFEVKRGMIEDTNSTYIQAVLEARGFKVTIQPVIDDDLDLIAGKLRTAAEAGYGLIITTGGVGAEDKDKTVEAIEKIDPELAAPYIVKFQKGTGRHVKDGVRVAVGTTGLSHMIAMPGPNDEVRMALDAILPYLETIDRDKTAMAQAMATVLRQKLQKQYAQKHAMGRHSEEAVDSSHGDQWHH
ncbi:competence/damage-inducible protein A [Fusibacter paucivorans]|uniref:Competence/damage-inducible protein A n=1 Tax=Fusibacter paucivorans TaxID=76009 RepID=A0ABS5PM01_9FIRM|nr:molybdopterin-binding protein [Fusibacter paucivorans]MBS7526190.1 competence/damage-inducible protein A [Fusibacter paucivorans]